VKQTYVCRNEDLHPYECDGPGACMHCDRLDAEDHDPRDCELCDLDGWETEPVPPL